jgi:protoheme IX farnesyltransferase
MMGILGRLTRPRLALLNGISAVAGCLLFPAPLDISLLLAVCAGVSLLAAGGSALNQVLERDLDRIMVRTMDRPLPRGELTPAAGVATGGTLLLAGLLSLLAVGGLLPALLGAGALAWYLLVYTPLKRRTPFALAVGALCGSLPPLLGWSAAGGNLFDYRIMLLAGLLYLWQIPHFWLFLRRHGDDYRRAGLPLPDFTGQGGVPAAFCRLWVVALVAAVLLLPAFGIITHHAPLWTAAVVAPLLFMLVSHDETTPFSCLHLFPLLLTSALFAQK